MIAPAVKSVQSVETDQEDNKEILERQFQETLSSEIPESAQLQLAAQLLGAVLIGYAENRGKVLSAFAVFNNKNYYNYLLKLRNTQTFSWIEQNFHAVKKEIDRQNNHPRNKGKQLDEYKARVGLFSQKIPREEFIRKSQAYTVASAVHQRINADDIRNKFGQTTAVFGLTPESTQDLKRSMAGWMKENPSRSYDEYMVFKGKQLYLQQQLKPGQKLDKDTIKQLEREHGKILKEKTATWRNQSDSFRVSTIKSQREIVIRAQEVIKAIQRGEFTNDQIKQQLDYILHGKIAAPAPLTTTTVTQVPLVVVPETIQTPLPVGPTTTVATPPLKFQQTVPSSLFRPSLETPPVITQAVSVTTPHVAIPAGRFAGLQKFFAGFRNSGFGKVLGGLGKGFGILGGGAGGLLTKGATALVNKLGIQAGMNTATGGLYFAASLIAGLFGIDLDRMVLMAAAFAVAVPVCLLLLIIIGINNPNTISQFSIGAENAEPVKMVSINKSSQLSWLQFEKKYLTKSSKPFEDNTSNWLILERENLLPQAPYLSLQK